MIRLGAPIFVKTEDPDELAAAHVSANYTAAYCPALSAAQTERLGATRKAFAKRDIVIAEVGVWRNIINPDELKHKENIKFACDQLAVADEVGALCCVTFAGTFDADLQYGPHPKNLTRESFDRIVDTIREIIQTVRPRHAKFCLEMMQSVFPDNVESYSQLITAIDSKTFGVHLDPVNIIYSPRQYFNTGDLLQECFDKLGPWIVSCHAKDIILRPQLSVHLDETPLGTGALDYREYLKGLKKLGRDVPLMIEHLSTEQEYLQARDFILSTANSL